MAACHDFTIIIPVADRPRQLAACLHSLEEMLTAYPYHGRVRVLIAEDSLDAANAAVHRQLTDEFAHGSKAAAVTAFYFGHRQQQEVFQRLPQRLRISLGDVLGTGIGGGHKGASVTRNLAMLWLRQQPAARRELFWFIDSDQEFRVSRMDDSPPSPLDYLNAIDSLFADDSRQFLTGKVVGDPPVSPAVMAGNFLQDVGAFLAAARAVPAQDACSFHGRWQSAADAAYHDMADLFGFADPSATERSFSYVCPLTGAHDHQAAFAAFAAGLKRFFDGEHPTRRSFYQPAPLDGSVVPARTVYTGNYVCTRAGLDYFIPFANLRLRMAGPTLGRIIRAEQGGRFVSANLPLLHRRTLDTLGRAECRPGIAHAADRIDLSAEFERQFYGDVMLFSMERLAGDPGWPEMLADEAAVAQLVDEIEDSLQKKYRLKHRQILAGARQVAARHDDAAAWWQNGSAAGAQSAPAVAEANQRFYVFLDNLQHNYSPNAPAWQMIGDARHRQRRLADIVAGLVGYPAARLAWREAGTCLRDKQ